MKSHKRPINRGYSAYKPESAETFLSRDRVFKDKPQEGRIESNRPKFGGSSSSSRFGSRFSSGRSFSKGRSFGHRGGRPSGRGNFGGGRIDISRFINTAVITEQVEHFVPEHKFTDFTIDERLKRNIISKGYIDPTPIQDKSINHIIRGQDVVGIANTGTGKTAAFLIPLINKVLTIKDTHVLVIVPTRELALQIEDELKTFTQGLGIFSVTCVGGSPIGRQIKELRFKNQFVIGTPGRLKDLMEQKYLRINEFRTVVLDEADRMLDMGFIADMRYMISKMSKPRHTLFFSATLSKEIESLIGEFLTEPVRISVKTQETSKNIHQDIVRIPRGTMKIDALHNLLIQPDFSKVLIFGRTKHGVEKLAKALITRGFKAESIHGDKSQRERQRALDAFKHDQSQVLVATDVAARGLDIAGITHVINFDMPATYDDYVHRIGRTGRGSKKGKALTFIE